jgi:hypothetical protein
MDSIMVKDSQSDVAPNCQRHAFPLLFKKQKTSHLLLQKNAMDFSVSHLPVINQGNWIPTN